VFLCLCCLILLFSRFLFLLYSSLLQQSFLDFCFLCLLSVPTSALASGNAWGDPHGSYRERERTTETTKKAEEPKESKRNDNHNSDETHTKRTKEPNL
jgi:hypothetical protein